MSMAWTRREPDAPGWWWIVEERKLHTARPRPADVYRNRAGELAMGTHSLAWWRDVAGMRFLWCGPIAEPPDVLGAELGDGD